MVVNIANYCCMQEMLKETETEETISFFCHIFILVASQLEGVGSLSNSLATRMFPPLQLFQQFRLLLKRQQLLPILILSPQLHAVAELFKGFCCLRKNKQISRFQIWTKTRSLGYFLFGYFVFHKSKNIALLQSSADIFEDLQVLRPRAWALRPRTSKSVIKVVLETKNVLQGFTSDNNY